MRETSRGLMTFKIGDIVNFINDPYRGARFIGRSFRVISISDSGREEMYDTLSLIDIKTGVPTRGWYTYRCQLITKSLPRNIPKDAI